MADKAGLEDDDIVVEVNGVNVEQSSHEEVVGMIRRSGDCLEMLVAKRSVYEKLNAKGVTITRLLLGETSYVDVHTSRRDRQQQEEARPDIHPSEPEKQRVSGSTLRRTSSFGNGNVGLSVNPPLLQMRQLCEQTFVFNILLHTYILAQVSHGVIVRQRLNSQQK